MFLKDILVFILIMATTLTASAENLDEARKPVDRLNETLIAVMKGGKQMSYRGRYNKLEPVVKDTFEFETVSQLALGGHWKNLDKPQKQAFIQKLTDLSIATYAAQFKEFGGESFKFNSNQVLKSGRMLLRYTFSAPKDKPIKFEYIVGYFNGQWQIISIIVDGISDLALRKAQYTSVIDREGFESLLNKISQKITDYSHNNGPG